MYTAMFKMDNQQGPTICSTGDPDQYHAAAWMGGELEKNEYMCMHA